MGGCDWKIAVDKLRRSESGISQFFSSGKRGNGSKFGDATDLFDKDFDTGGVDASDPGVVDISTFYKRPQSAG